MRIRFVVITLMLLIAAPAIAQKYAYVNTEYILSNIPAYKAAMESLDNLSVQWQKEIEDKYAIIDKLYKTYQAEQVLLTDEMKKQRQDEITTKQKDLKNFQKQLFRNEA